MSLQDYQRNLLVEASAGSGKTHNLVGRIVGALCAGEYTLQHVAAVTFTRKAAAELSTRLRLGLLQHKPELLERFPDMFIGTVHSFCGRILREYPVESQVSPGFRELDEAEDLLLQRRVLRVEVETPLGREALRTLREFGGTVADLALPLKVLCDRGAVQYPAERLPRPELESDWDAIDRFARECPPQQRDGCKLSSALQSLEQQRLLADRQSPRDLLKLLGTWEAEIKPLKRSWGKTRQEQDRALEPVLVLVTRFREELVEPRLALWRGYLYGVLLPFLAQVRKAAHAERRARGLVNYNDLLVCCQQLIRRHPRVLAQLQSQFRHLFVDEFQDTDPLQAELFLSLAGATHDISDWKQVTLRPGSLFLVGDPKQSIYRFRDADIETYQLVRTHLVRSGGTVVPLTTSFRSNDTLCRWINQVFGCLLPEAATHIQAAYSPLHSQQEQVGPLPAVCTLTTSCQRANDVARDEARRIAAWISRQGRPYSDYLILTSRRAEMRIYERELELLGVPCVANVEPQPVSDSGRILLHVLAVLSNPTDIASLVGVLRGECFGHTDRELFLHVQKAGYLRLAVSEGTTVATSLTTLAALRQQVRSLPPGAAARQVSSELGLADLYPELETTADALANLGEKGFTLAQAVAELQVEDAQVLPCPADPIDAVRVMNLHTAKGLEAPVVFLAAPMQGLPLHVEHLVDEHGKGALCLRRYRKLFAHPHNWSDLQQREEQFLEAERVRLLYVAATRARECLVVGRWTGPVGTSPRPWSMLEPFLEGAPELPHAEPVSHRVSSIELGHDEALQLRQEASRRLAACAAPRWRRHTVTTSNKKPGFHVSLAADPALGEGRDWGDLIHRLLEQLVRRPEITPDELLQLATWYAVERPELSPYLAGAVQQLQRVRETPFWSEVLAARQRLVEVPFGHASGPERIFGIIDLVLQQDEGWDILDYKTDRKRMEDLLHAYTPQLAQYAKSWGEITGAPVRSAGIFGVREGQVGRVGEGS